MTLKALSRSLDEVAAHLPFAVSDYERANEAFGRWRRSGREEDHKVVVLWVYCYTRRYFLAKFIHDPGLATASLDEPVGKAFQRACASFDKVEQPDRFVNYVSVICRRTFINFGRRQAQFGPVDLEQVPEPHDPADAPVADWDLLVLHHAFEGAFKRLPDSLREVAHMRLVEKKSYEEMEEATGRSQPVLRSYVHKALLRLREDAALQDFSREWNE